MLFCVWLYLRVCSIVQNNVEAKSEKKTSQMRCE